MAKKSIGPQRLTTEGGKSSIIRRIWWGISQWICTNISILTDWGWLWGPFDHVKRAQPAWSAESRKSGCYVSGQSITRGLSIRFDSAQPLSLGISLIKATMSSVGGDLSYWDRDLGLRLQ